MRRRLVRSMAIVLVLGGVNVGRATAEDPPPIPKPAPPSSSPTAGPDAPEALESPIAALEITDDGALVLDGKALGKLVGATPEELGQTEDALRARLQSITAGSRLRKPDGTSLVAIELRASRSTKWRFLEWIMRISSEPAIKIYTIHFSVTKQPPAGAPAQPADAPPPARPAAPPSEATKPLAAPAKEGEVPSWAKVAPEQIEAAKKAGVRVVFENSIGMRFVLIPAGTFTMGSPTTEEQRRDYEVQHEVTLTKPYYMGVTEVTNAQFRRHQPSHESGNYKGEGLNGNDQPAVKVSHDDATAFVSWLNGEDGAHAYRLPTEAEWEHACRAGTKTARWWGDDNGGAKGRASVADVVSKVKFGWPDAFDFDDGYRVSAPVRSFAPSPWAVYDMLGNVWEWCADWEVPYAAAAATDPRGPSSGEFRVLRGGSWVYDPRFVRAASRFTGVPGARFDFCGFRVVSSLGAP